MNPERVIWLVRHGNRLDFVEPDWVLSAPRPHDPPLSPDGFHQARETGRRLAAERIDHLFCSPFLRAVQTACTIAETLRLPVKVEHGLAELMLLKWFPDQHDFLPLPELTARFPQVDPSYRFARGPDFPETPETANVRAIETARALLARYDGNLLLIGHGGSIFGLSEGILGFRPSLQTDLCCLIKLARQAGAWRLESDGSDRSHLSGAASGIRPA